MSANAKTKAIRAALGVLQAEPDNVEGWAELRDLLGFTTEGGTVDPGEVGASELAELLRAARAAHEARREYEAVAELLEIEIALATGDTEANLAAELAHVRDDKLLDDAGAIEAYKRLLALRPSDEEAQASLERAEAKKARWKDLAQRYFTEAKTAEESGFKASLLVSAAEIAYRYGKPELEAKERREAAEAGETSGPTSKKGKKKRKDKGGDGGEANGAKKESKARTDLVEKIVGLLKNASELDPKNARATLLLERILRDEGRWEDLAAMLQRVVKDASREERVAGYIRLARVYDKKLGDREQGAAAYGEVLDLVPGQPEATRMLVDWFTENEKWDHLVSLYEGQLSGGGVRPGDEAGILLQIAMVNWRMRHKPDAAEPYFERVRKLEPAHPGMLAFFRDWCREKGEAQRLVAILGDAQRALPDASPERAALATEIATLAEEGANAQKAIEQWRGLLRQDPNNDSARDSLKRLFRATGAFNHLADLLRADLERMGPNSDPAARLPVLREIATIYRDNIKSDSALVTVLSQIIALDTTDASAVRELARVYEALGRWRDLLTTQMRLAELEADPGTKAELYRAIARRWLEQFSNVQNAVESYEKLRESLPDDREALEKLRELYTKRRAYKPLFDLMEHDASKAEGAARREIWMEMARIAEGRLDRGADATRLYKMILAEEPNDLVALDALEKQAERDKDFVTVADALERRAAMGGDSAQRLVVLQKLGSVYADRLQDPAGSLRTWRRVLELAPGHPKALRILRESYLALGDFDGLSELYAQANDWEGLVEVLSSTADRVTDLDAKIDLSFRSAKVLEERIGQPDRAFRAYERVLSVKPDDVRATTALVPIYEREEKWSRLPALYEALVGHAKDDAEKRALYKKLAVVTGHKLSDRATAFKYAQKGYALAPLEQGALRELEEWARASGEWVGFTESIEQRLAVSTDEDELRGLRLKLAEISASHAGRPDEAIAAYKALIESNEADEGAIAALDRLLRSAPERRDDLRWLFRLRAGRAESNEARIAILAEQALLEEEAFGAPERAVDIYREILELAPADVRALRALARLLLAAGDAAGAAAVIKRERDLHEGESRVEREIELARLELGPLRNPREALAAAKRALELSPNDPQVIAVVEELLPLSETRAAAAIVLERAYEATGQWNKQADVLMVLIATAPSKADRLDLFSRLADVRQKLGDIPGAFEVMTRAAQDYPQELDIWDRLAVLANKTHHTQEFVEAIAQAVPPTGETGLPAHVEMDLAERAATLYDEMLGDIDRATPYLERILRRDPGNDRAFLRLKQILTTREKWADLEALYERMIAATNDPGRRADLLNEVALIAEEITGDAPKAIGYYERILELEPAHDQAIFALDKLYASEERWRALADLLVRRLSLAGGGDTTQLELRLGTLLFVRLDDPKAALDHLEKVVVADSSIREARELVERCLEHPELRQRAAIILEGVYVEREEMRDLVRVLEVRLEFVHDDVERKDLLRRIAELRDERLTDDRGAFDTYARLLPLAPADVEARQRYLDIAQRLGRTDDAADVLMVAAKNAETPQPRAEILGDVARIYEATEQPERAESVHRQVLDLAPEDPSIALPAARALERLYSQNGKSVDLTAVLRIQVRLEDDAGVRRELLGRLGTLSEDVLKDDAGAIVAWKERLEDDPADEQALVALDRLYERTAQYRELVEVLRTRERQAEGADARKVLMVRTAETLAERIGDVDEALLAYRAVLDDFGAERSVLAALAKLYAKAERWRDLAETREAELAIATERTERITLLTALGDVRRERLGETTEAIESYRQALTLDPSVDGEAVAALRALEAILGDARSENADARREVAEILRPLYEASGKEANLVSTLDIQIEHEGNLEARLELYARAVEVTEGSLGEPGRAFGYASRALKESAGEAQVGTWIDHVERLAKKTADTAALVSLYRDVIPDVLDEDRQVGLFLRVADLANSVLGDRALAIEYYKKALDLRPEERRALVALEALYGDAKEYELLLEILKRRAEVAETDDAKREVLYKQAKICDEAIQDRDRAIGAYEEVLELGMDPPAIAALERLYHGAQRWGDLVALHERELGAEPADPKRRADLHHALGRIHASELAEIDRAFDEYAEALRVDGGHAPTIAALEALMRPETGEATHAGRAAEMLEQVYLSRLDWRNVMAAISARLDASEDPDERRQLFRRLAKLHEEQEENYTAALEVTARLFAEDLGDESTWAELERLARVANAEARLAEIYAGELEKVTSDEPATARLAYRTGELLAGQKEDARALAFYQRAYKFSPEEAQDAFAAIDKLLARLERPQGRIALYRDALEYRTAPEERVATLHAIATLEEESLGDADAAIDTHRAILDTDETDVRALDALARLYTTRERWRDLADLHRRRAEQSALPEEEAKWRLVLAGTLEERLGETASAIDELEAVLALVPAQGSDSGRAAVVMLERFLGHEAQKSRVVELLRPIYERDDDWKKLVDVARHRFALAGSPQEKVEVLRDTAKLLEERGNDIDGAFRCLHDAFILDPDDGETREQLDRLAVATERWDDLADAYEKGIAKIDGVGQRELLEALARLHDKRRDDPRRALDAWNRLFELDESDDKPLDEMDQLATLLSDWPTLVRVLAKRAELTNDDEERASLWRRIGEARRDMLDDAAGAIEAYDRALELEPTSAFTMDNLIGLLEARPEQDPPRLVELYRRRIAECTEDDADLKHVLLLDAAKVVQSMGDRREAIALLGEALAGKPSDPEVMARLADLYEAEGMWAELLENLRARFSVETEPQKRAVLTKRMARLLAAELDDHARALAAYRDVFQLGYDEEAAKAVRAIGEAREELRAEAAAILLPVLEAAGLAPQVADALEMRLRSETEPHERAATLRAIATVAETQLADRGLAEDALLRALVEIPNDGALHARIEKVAALLGRVGWERYADALSDRSTADVDAATKSDLCARLGKVAEEHLSDLPRAAEAYARAAEIGGDTPALLKALERVYGAREDTRALVDVIERRIAIESEPAEQADLYHRLASLQIGVLGDKSQGLGTLRLALEKRATHPQSREAVEQLLEDDALFDDAFETLEGTYRKIGLNLELGGLYARRVARATTTRERVRARLEHARILENDVFDAGAALAAAAAAVIEDPQDPDALTELERLAGVTGNWRDATDALAKALAAADERGGASPELWARLGTWRRDRVDDATGAEVAFVRALELDPENVALVRAMDALTRAPGRERDRIAVLRRLGRLEGEPETKRALAKEAVELAENVLADSKLAEDVLRELLAENETDGWAVAELTRLREMAGDHREVVTLLLRRAEAEADPGEATRLRHRAADVAADQLGDRDKAIALYEEILEADPHDVRARDRLRELYAALGKWNELAKLLAMLVDNASSVEERAALRIDLAALQRERFEATADAIDTLRAVLEEDRDHHAAASALASIFEQTKKYTELADLQTQLVESARDRGDGVAAVERMVRLGQIFEEKVQDPAAALKTYEAILDQEPNHREALEAVARLAEGRGAWDKAAGALARLSETASGEGAVALALRLANAREELHDDAGVEQALKRALEAEPRNADVRGRLRKLYEKTKQWAELASLLVSDADLVESDSPAWEPPPAPAGMPARASRPPGGSLAPAPTAPPHVGDMVKLLRRAAEIHLKERSSPADAVPILERVTTLVPTDRELLLLLVDAYTAAGRDRDAANVLERVIASFGAKRTKELSVYHHRLGKALAALGDKDVALAQYDMAFKIDPGSIEVLRDLGVLALENNDLDRAQKTFRALLLQRLDPGAGISKGEVFYYLGEISMRQGDKAKAVQMLERAVENEPSLQRARAMLTEIKG